MAARVWQSGSILVEKWLRDSKDEVVGHPSRRVRFRMLCIVVLYNVYRAESITRGRKNDLENLDAGLVALLLLDH